MALTMEHEIRTTLVAQLGELESQAMGGFDEVGEQLVSALRAVIHCDAALAAAVVAADRPINHRYLDLHQGAITLLASQAPVAGDLRLVAALLHIIWCLERMGDQCVNIAKLVPLSGYESPRDDQMLAMIERMGRLVARQIVQAMETFVSRNVELAEDLALQDSAVDTLNRQVFQRAVDIGDDVELREWAMFMVLIARALERIGDNTVDVAEQTVFLVTGELRELIDVRLTARTEDVGTESD
jgi:phosphate transport system protein